MAGEERIVLLEKYPEDGIAKITFNRPEKRNALNRELLEGIMEALEELHDDERIGAIITAGAGGISYCAGMDLYYLRQENAQRRHWDRPSLLVRLMEQMRHHPMVTIAQVQGYCLGGGLALLMAHDLAVAGESAQIGMPEIIRGSFGQLATSSMFHSQVPMKKAFYTQLTGRNMDGLEAERVGLVSKAVPDDQVEPFTYALAKEVASHNHAALAHAKIAAYMGRDVEYAKALRLDELVGARMRRFVDPFADLPGYLGSQRGGTEPGYTRPDQRPAGAG